MNNKYMSTKNNYNFSELKTENNYNCQGSCCTCKYLNNRSPFDVNQIVNTDKVLHNTDYEKSMFISFKNKK